MVEVNQAQLEASMRAFSASVRNKAIMLGQATSAVLRSEANRLCQTLMRITPPANQSQAKAKIEKDVRRKLGTLEGHDESFSAQFNPMPVSKQGSGSVRWFLWTESVLLGADKTKDMRTASGDDLYRLYWNTVISKSGLINPGNRGKQKVRIIQRHTFSAAGVRGLIKRLQSHLGRIKAGWSVAWKATGAGTGIYRPPEWVLRHLTNGTPRGGIVDASADASIPSITITNHAKGADSAVMRVLANHALRLRMGAMPKRVAQILKFADQPEKYQAMLAQEVA
jgi:hypothetical protein